MREQRTSSAAINGRLFRRGEAAAYLGVGLTTIYKLERCGILRPLTLPGLRGPQFDRNDLDRLISAAKGTGAMMSPAEELAR